MMPESRPLFSWSIVQLENEFTRAHSGNDQTALKLLEHELSFRDTNRAAKLSERVIQAISTALDKVDQTIVPALPANGVSESLLSTSVSDYAAKPDGEPLRRELPPPTPPRIDTPRRAPLDQRPVPGAEWHKQLTPDEVGNVLSTWIALEVLSPAQTYGKPVDLADGDNRRIANFEATPELPWERGEKARPKTRLFYQIVMGAIVMEAATEKLLGVYGDQDIERVNASGFAPIAILTVDSKGVPVEPTAITISSFAWGFPRALRQQLLALAEWPTIELQLVEEADKLVRQRCEDGRELGVDRNIICRLYEHLIDKLELPAECVVPPEIAIRVYQWWKAEEPPDPPPMGSFFLGDLSKAKRHIDSGDVPELLQTYLGLRQPPKRYDLRCDDAVLAESVAPARMPLGRWPLPYPLVLLQQAAVNLAISRMGDVKLLPVNGPPGTGKTTLLKDLVASMVVQRAQAMCEFANPNDAFVTSGQKFKSGNSFTHHYLIDKKLTGFEMLVASSNNKAVENVSAELPTLKAFEGKNIDLHYFASVADSVTRGFVRGSDDGVERVDSVENSPSNWGLIAAVLGNSKNRYAFSQIAWRDSDNGLRAYLLEASGNPQTIEVKDPKTGRIVEQRKPRVVTAEKPPKSADIALKRWKSARKSFLEAIKRVEERLVVMEKGRHALTSNDFHVRHKQNSEVIIRLDTRLAEIGRKTDGIAAAAARSNADRIIAENSLAAHDQNKPGFLSGLLSSPASVDWDKKRAMLIKARDESVERCNELRRAMDTIRSAESLVKRGLSDAKKAEEQIIAAMAAQTADIENAVSLSGARFVDAAFFDRTAGDLHRDTPWLDAEILRLREEVFIAAMTLHRAFVDVAAKQIRNNLDLLFRTFSGRSAWSGKMRPLMAGLWSTFFCVVPVVSTTFASVERMFGYLDPESLGWLLIDEAGQASPQAAIGALSRVRRAVVVGDPQQLPPVTSLPTELADKISAQFKVDEDRFVAPSASVQMLADASSSNGTVLTAGGSPIWVGVPLVVHSRCAEPMFSLSNSLAYGNMMVLGRGGRPSTIRDVLGPSAWIDIRPDYCEDKWSLSEGRAVIELLRKLDRAELDKLDVYIVSPFRIVAQNLRRLLVAERVLTRWTDDPYRWVNERVGTVYTVQGRQADTVIMVLGAAQPERRGARNWAGKDVNQLNVAVTRAKENLYVIGNRFEWASAGEFEHLERQFL